MNPLENGVLELLINSKEIHKLIYKSLVLKKDSLKNSLSNLNGLILVKLIIVVKKSKIENVMNNLKNLNITKHFKLKFVSLHILHAQMDILLITVTL